ncbi:MAG: flagellar hook-basal body complex protein [Planctomycetaceae bacterium]|jgi:flagellar hook protein FlgE|nr:flagellar hook-basal body complex protein [Planctomycetaceae bacterium]
MGLFDAMNVAHTGMSAAETSIAVIGNNLSNANTTAFKSQRADFETIYARYYSLGSSPQMSNYTAGSNPIQIGQGVVSAGTTTDFSQGAIKPGMTNTDMAINGNGFFIINSPDGTRQYFTRNGVFKLNSNQELITQDGDYVMGYTVNDHYQIQTDKLSKLTIAVGKMTIAEATQNVSIEGLLNAVGDSSTQGTVLESVAMTDLSWSSPEPQAATVEQAARPSVEMSQTSAADNAGDGNLDAGNYLYRFVYSRLGCDHSDQTDYSSPINVMVANDASSVTIDHLPLEQIPSNTTPPYTHITIYRAVAPTNPAEEPIFYQVDEIPVAVAGTVYTDTKSNAEIAGNPTLDLSRLEGSYQYYVTFIDANGNESRPSAVSASINVNSGKVTLSDVPTVDSSDNPDGWIGRKIYRSVAGGDQDFYLVETIDNMSPNVTITDGASDAELVEHEKMSFGGKGNVLANASTLLSNVGVYNESGRFVPMFANGTLELTPNKGGNDLKTANMTITDATTMSDYLKFLNDAYGIRTNASDAEIPKDQGEIGQQINGGSAGAAIKDGKIVVLGNAGVQNELQISANDFKLIVNGKIQTLDFQFNETQQCVGDGISTDLLVYDSLGAPINVHLTLTLESKSNTETVYRWYADSIDNQPANGSNSIAVGSGVMRFDSEGKLIDSGETAITIQRTDVASYSPLSFSFNMDMSAVAALATNSQTLSMTEQDGAGAGVLYDYSVDANGVIIGTFTSGVTRPLGQVLLAAFVNNEGLLQTGENMFTVGPNSGSPQIGIPGQGVFGKIAGNSVEMSNTDIGNELIEMITASSMYRANAKIITTSNEMLAALLNMV